MKADLRVLRTLPALLRGAEFKVTAVLGGDQLGEFVAVFVHQLPELEEDPGARGQRAVGPVVGRLDRRCDRSVHIRLSTEDDLASHLTGRRLEDIAAAGGRAGRANAVDPVLDEFGHGVLLDLRGGRADHQ